MKIGIDGRAAKWYRGTGIGTYTYELINYFNYCHDLQNDHLFVHLCGDVNLPDYKNHVQYVPAVNSYKNNFWDEVLVPNEIDQLKLDLYHIPQNGIGMPLNQNCPYIITLHDIIPCKLPQTVSDKFLSIFNKYMPSIIENAKAIITVSQFSKDDIAREFNYDKNHIHVTHLASEEIYKPLNKSISKSIIKEQYNICSDYILYVGGFSPRKNILGLIEAFYTLKKRYKTPIKLVIAGTKGLSYEIYKTRVHELSLDENVLFPGFIQLEHMPYLYNAAEFLAYPSLYEGFGLPPLEAMSCGIPVISSNITSIPEVLGDAAKLINPMDFDELSLAMEEMLTDKKLYHHYKKLSLEKAKNYSWEKTVQKTVKAYHDTLHI
ncbi:Glycosyltransferase involved in cell wall bisynthesis [Hathewaya proteolytica DSM 3090]|uniref:Glycosyltransferase involved in cell wall bisynthesis n=1 Tax=Hathewaya proteolytica DSM 3090 TaxID=1121331 RepID=A0A1M6PG54_9CLOT|nr:glycosyltransferase family 1 protein [Hathewaya proteolytica]SHK06872.1 Glycosyltransferase involved in cell wall bisynthesis [Hathewaya proteolytica DSM 3090]